jgi:hypothetical protein
MLVGQPKGTHQASDPQYRHLQVDIAERETQFSLDQGELRGHQEPVSLGTQRGDDVDSGRASERQTMSQPPRQGRAQETDADRTADRA